MALRYLRCVVRDRTAFQALLGDVVALLRREIMVSVRVCAVNLDPSRELDRYDTKVLEVFLFAALRRFVGCCR